MLHRHYRDSILAEFFIDLSTEKKA